MAALPVQPGLALRTFAGQKLQRRQPPETSAMDSLNKHGLPTETTAPELMRLTNAPRTKSAALAAKGRTARGGLTLVPLAKRHLRRFDTSRWLARECIRLLRCLTLELSGGGATRLDDWLGRRWIVATTDVGGYEMKSIATNGAADSCTEDRKARE